MHEPKGGLQASAVAAAEVLGRSGGAGFRLTLPSDGRAPIGAGPGPDNAPVGQTILAVGPTCCSYFCGRGQLSDYGIRFVWYSGLLGPESVFDVRDHSYQGFTRRSTNYNKVHCKDKELSA